MNVWDRLFPPIPTLPPLQPQIEAWTDNSHLYDVVLSDLGVQTTQLGRRGAMRVPAVARARNLTCGTVAALPLQALRIDTPVDPQPYWLFGTDGQLGDLADADRVAWHVTPQTPLHRMLWTVDDLLFYGESLWVVSLWSTPSATGRAFPLRMVRVPWDYWTVQDGVVCDLDGHPLPADRVVYFPGPHEGILDFGADTIASAFDLERTASEVAAHPFRLELHQTSAAELTPTERAEIVAEARAALSRRDGILFTNNAVETVEHRMDSDALQLGARNASALDIARLANMPAAMLDATSQGASLEYQTLEGRNQQWLDYGLSLYTDAIEARLSMDDIVPAGQRVAFDTSDWTTVTPSPTGPPAQD